MTLSTVLNLVGIGLLLLAAASGIALFVRAVGRSDKFTQGPGLSTLWGLFLIGLMAGLMLVAVSEKQ
ncbi:MAG: hypothetical protein IPM55_01335 [Acidobacteria bacterium]|nr:hypothetical protein [Acidobacteriota bacterium]